MDGAAPAGTRRQPANDHTGPRVAVLLGSQGGSGSAGRVEVPDRVLRMWSLLNAADEELHQMALPAGAEARLARQMENIVAELEQSVSPMLATELRHLFGHSVNVPLTADEVRVEYAGVLGWASGLVLAMLDQLAAAPARLADQDATPSSSPA